MSSDLSVCRSVSLTESNLYIVSRSVSTSVFAQSLYKEFTKKFGVHVLFEQGLNECMSVRHYVGTNINVQYLAKKLIYGHEIVCDQGLDQLCHRCCLSLCVAASILVSRYHYSHKLL